MPTLLRVLGEHVPPTSLEATVWTKSLQSFMDPHFYFRFDSPGPLLGMRLQITPATYNLAQRPPIALIMDINQLINPPGSESPRSKKSSTSPAYTSTLPAYASFLPAYGAASAYSTSGTSVTLSLAQGGPVHAGPPSLTPNPQAPADSASQTTLTEESPAKKHFTWTPEEDARVIELRGQRKKWTDIAKQMGRSPNSCRLRYQNYLEKHAWDEEKKNKLAILYARYVQS